MNDGLTTVIQRLHASEIHVGLQSNFDDAIDVWLGDGHSGRTVKRTFTLEQLPMVARWLDEMACVLFPDSDYACEEKDRDGSRGQMSD